MGLNFLTVEKFTLSFNNKVDDKILHLSDDKMEVDLHNFDGLIEFGGLKWTPLFEGRISMRMTNKYSYEIELKSSGISKVFGYGNIWKITYRTSCGSSYEYIASFTISDVVDGNIERKPNSEPRPYWKEDEAEDDEMGTFEQFCDQIGLSHRCAQKFREEGLEFEQLQKLTEQDMQKSLKLNLGERMKIRDWQSLNKEE